MKLRLDKKKQGTYEKTNGLRYFGNEKFRKENYFGKQKLQVRTTAADSKLVQWVIVDLAGKCCENDFENEAS